MRSNSRSARAYAKQQKSLEAANVGWKIWKRCEVCGNDFCVNCAWEDRKPRTPRFQGVVVCMNCDPRTYDPYYPYVSDQILRTRRGRARYKIVMAIVLVRAMAKKKCMRGSQEDCKCLPCLARKLDI